MLSISNGNPCGILNTDFAAPATYQTIIGGANGTKGTLQTFTAAYASKVTTATQVLASTSTAASSPRLVRYLSGEQDGTARNFSQICLRVGSTTAGAFEGIVDTYIVGSASKGLNKGATYTYTSESGLGTKAPLTPQNIDAIRTALLTNGSLLKDTELYVDTQLGSSAPAITSTNLPSLLYLYKLTETELNSNTLPTNNSVTYREYSKTLETKNLKFFSAFLVEYCFYRARYEKMLQDYFTIFQMTDTEYTGSTYAPITSDIENLMVVGSSSDTGYTAQNNTIPRANLLTALAYHMACLKTRMTDMIRLLNSINSYYNSTFTTIQNAINSGNLAGSSKSLQESISLLNASTEESKQYMTEAQFRQGAMEYTQEKNRNANILLGLYAFLNVTALAIIFRVASS